MLGLWNLASLLGSVFIASLLGSTHCIGMCGPLVSATCKTSTQTLIYQFGRLVSYLLLGALAGGFGSALVQQSYWPTAGWVASSLLSVLLIWSGGRLLLQKQMHLNLPQMFKKIFFSSNLWLFKNISYPNLQALGIGALSIFIPCGWLYLFVGAALATNQIWHGVLILFVFWLGTFPAMTLSPVIFQKFIVGRVFAQKLAGIILILGGLISVQLKIQNLITHGLHGSTAHTQQSIFCVNPPKASLSE